MAKPIGPRCNLKCEYCYYLEKGRFYPSEKKFRMPETVLEDFIRQTIDAQYRAGSTIIWLLWQGGEPTMLGLDYFRKTVELEKKHAPGGVVIRNAIQTNATLLDEEWATFLRQNEFLVGVSIDGPRKLHDRHRKDRAGQGTFDQVTKGARLLLDHGVEVNALCVVHRENARKPRDVYRFLTKTGFRHIQFIPVVERTVPDGSLTGPPQTDQDIEAQVSRWSVLPKDYGDFLNAIFDEWVLHDVGKVFVQFIEVQLGLWLGGPASLCVFAEECGNALALEHNGDLYACDHYVYPDYRLGNIRDASLIEMAHSPEQIRFGEEKRTRLPTKCRECRFLFACNGGCPKHRMIGSRSGEAGLNYFCESYLRFFRHAGPMLKEMARLHRSGRPMTEIMETARRRSNRKARRAGIGYS